MRQLIAQQLIESIQQAVDDSCPLWIVVSDADGTLWSGDVGVDAFEALLARKLVRLDALDALCDEAETIGLPQIRDPNAMASALYQAFCRHEFAEVPAYEMMAWAFAGWTSDELRLFCCDVYAEQRLEERVHPEMRTMLHWLHQAQLPVCVVSASPLIVVQEAAKVLGLPAEGVIAATPAVDANVIQPRMGEPIPFAEGKVLAIRARHPTASIIAAFGDNSFDLEMMTLAAVPVAVRPKDRLLKRAAELQTLVELRPD